MTKNIVIAVDAKERTLDALALGLLLTTATQAPAVLMTVFGYFPLEDPDGAAMVSLREDARTTLLELGSSVGLDGAEAHVVAGNFAGRELQRVTEASTTGLLVVGSTMRGPAGRLLLGGIGERMLSGAACSVAIAPRGYGDRPPARLDCIGVGFDGSEEAQRALDAAITIAHATTARLRVITAFPRMAFGGVAAAGMAGRSVNDALRSELRALHDTALAEAGTSVPVEGRFLDGSAEEVTVQESGDVDLLVAGSRGYGPRGAVLIGSTTAALARGASSPLLVTPRGTRFDLLT